MKQFLAAAAAIVLAATGSAFAGIMPVQGQGAASTAAHVQGYWDIHGSTNAPKIYFHYADATGNSLTCVADKSGEISGGVVDGWETISFDYCFDRATQGETYPAPAGSYVSFTVQYGSPGGTYQWNANNIYLPTPHCTLNAFTGTAVVTSP